MNQRPMDITLAACEVCDGCHQSHTSHAANVMTHITSLEPERPIYYDSIGKIQVIHDDWTLLMYYNLSNYWDGVHRIEDYLKDLDNLCLKTDPRYCKTSLAQLQHEMELLRFYNIILLAPHKHLSARKRRGLIDGVGYLSNSLFGILDQRFADKYQNDIRAVHNKENYLLALIKNQTSIVELENKVLQKNEQNIKKQFLIIKTFMNDTKCNLAKVETELEIAMATSYFNSAALSAYLLINNLKSVQEMLFNTLTDVYKGHIDVYLVPPVNLIKQLSEITGNLPKGLSLSVDGVQENIKDLYKLLYIKARVTEVFFLFEIHIPLIADEDFTLHRVIPLPVNINSRIVTVRTSYKYIAVNFEKNTYVSLMEEDVKQCIQMKPENFICEKNLPVFNLQNNNAPCEAKLLGHQTTAPCDVMSTSCKEDWIELHPQNSWLVVCCGSCALRTICDYDVTSHTLTSSAIVTLSQGCVMQSKHLTIHSHNQYNSKVKINLNLNIPKLDSSINKVVNVTYHNYPHLYFSEMQDEVEIDRKLSKQMEDETTHDIHQYTICYLLLSIVITAAILWVMKRYCPLSCLKRTQTSTRSRRERKPQHQDIELQPIPHKREPGNVQEEIRVPQSNTANENIAFHFD